jgi:hypothetical protein
MSAKRTAQAEVMNKVVPDFKRLQLPYSGRQAGFSTAVAQYTLDVIIRRVWSIPFSFVS